MQPYDTHASDEGAPQEGETVRAGTPLDRSKSTVAGEEAVIEALRSVFDPEIPVNIYDLGLIYDLKIHDNGNVDVKMTLTAPACPVAGTLPKEVADVVARVEGVGETSVSITWDPPWTPANMSEVARVALDMF
ncbi:MAG: SUF system Fe-S cluster assembly protein [Rhodospirillaceae bacterium]|nr:MAG: SUF system Fe-S cluster assembly protein [Rhodospirillaceae bacterium]